MRLRTSAGVKVVAVYGNCGAREHTLYFPVMPARTAVAFELKVEATASAGALALFQCAVLWTDTENRRIIRVFTFSLPTSDAQPAVRASVDEAAVAAFFIKKYAPFRGDSRTAAEGLRTAFAAMRAGGASYQSLYHFVHSALGSTIIRDAAPFGIDWKIAEALRVRALSVFECLLYLYPRMLIVDFEEPTPLPLVGESFQAGYVVVVHTYTRVFVWANPEIQAGLAVAYFGATEMPQEVPQLTTPQNERLRQVITDCYRLSGTYLPVEIIAAGSPREAVFKDLLVDMSTESGSDLPSFLKQATSFY
jgi:hypothetical protein